MSKESYLFYAQKLINIMKTISLFFLTLFFSVCAMAQNNSLTKSLPEDSLIKKGGLYYYHNDLFTGSVSSYFATKQIKSLYEVKEGKTNGMLILFREDTKFYQLDYQDSLLVVHSKNQLSDNKSILKITKQTADKIHDSIRLLEEKWGIKKINKLLADEKVQKLKVKYVPIVENWHQLETQHLRLETLINQLTLDNETLKKIIEEEQAKPMYSNQVLGKGLFMNDLQNGKWTYYHDNKQISGTGNFVNGDQTDKNDYSIPKNGRDGKWILYYKNGNKEQESIYKDGKLNGFLTLYFENGNKQQESNCKDGKFEGLRILYYENGIKQRESIYKDDKLEGLTKLYYQNGNKQQESIYKDGKTNGLQQVWFENGNKKQEFIYKDGKLNGFQTLYFENGNKEQESIYKDDKLEGLTKLYYQNGNKKEESIYKDDKLEGLTKLYYENGNKKQESIYKDDKLNGFQTLYFENEFKKQEVMFKNGIEDGSFKQFYQNGKAKVICMKNPNAKHQNNVIGDYFEYNEDGSLINKLHFNMDGAYIDNTPKPVSTFSTSEANKAYRCACCNSSINGIQNGIKKGEDKHYLGVEFEYNIYNQPENKQELANMGVYSSPYELLREKYKFCSVKCTRICY